MSDSAGILSAFLLVSALAAGCGGREYGWEDRDGSAKEKPVVAADAGRAGKLEAEASATWALRDQEPELLKTIATLTKVLEAKGGNDYATLVWLSRANYLLGEMRDDVDKKIAAYEDGMRWGDLALNTIPAFRERFAKSQAVEDACESVGKEGIDAIYWDAVNQGKWAKAKGITKALFIKDKVKRMYERVVTLDESWFHGAGHRSLGAFWSALPSISGRDLVKSRQHFDKSLGFGPNYFATRVLIADLWARNSNDRKTFKKELELVLKTAPEALPECAPENKVEQRKAKRLLDLIDDDFDEEEPSEPAPAPAGKGAPGGRGS